MDEEAGNISIIGQVIRRGSGKSAHISYIAPARSIFTPGLAEMMDHLARHAGEMGVFHLLVDADEHSQFFDALRRTGFSVYAWQRIWKYNPGAGSGSVSHMEIPPNTWQPPAERDMPAVRILCQSLVPTLVQPVEPMCELKTHGLLIRSAGRICAFADIRKGSEGVWVQPFIHPEAGNIPGILVNLLRTIAAGTDKTTYISVRSYQAWIESALEDLPVFASPRQALMVRHLAVMQKETTPAVVLEFEKSRVKPGPVAHSETGKQV